MANYHNECDAYAAAWLRNLIAGKYIAPGIVDERSIEDIAPDDLKGFTQCHFFAGIGIWSLSLRAAGWPDDRPVWTGSCPCQPFSAAGKGAGFADQRHLWPHFYHLISQRRPANILGEQVAAKAVEPWIDLVHADLEALGYGFGCVPFPSAGVGAPHIRDRAYWAANATDGRRLGRWSGQTSNGRNPPRLEFERLCGLEHTRQDDDSGKVETTNPRQPQSYGPANLVSGPGVSSCGLADTSVLGRGARRDGNHAGDVGQQLDADGGNDRPGPTNGHWSVADWLHCRDGKWRPVEPGTFPLAHGATSRVGRLRAYGNALNAKAAQAFIEAVMDCQP